MLEIKAASFLRNRLFWLGALFGIVCAGAVLVPVGLYSFRFGVRKGYRLGEEHERYLLNEFAPSMLSESGNAPHGGVPPSPTVVAPPPVPAAAPKKAADAPQPLSPEIQTREAWCFTPAECVRLVWPMELMERTEACAHLHFRVREGANRLSAPGTGLCEFVFAVDKPARVMLFVHCRYSDDCGNSLRWQLDGGPIMPLGNVMIFDQWRWDDGHYQIGVSAGTHRLTILTREDGLEFDRVVMTSRFMPPGELDALKPTAAPVFESLPLASSTLPVIENVSAAAMADHSLVFGAGHQNTLSVFLRLNGAGATSGEVRLRRAGSNQTLQSANFELTPRQRTDFIHWDVPALKTKSWLVPLQVDVFAQGRCVHSQVLNFMRPLSWAFLGPFPDPEHKGLYLPLEPDKRAGELFSRPEFAGARWKVVEDGSCYNDFGLIDLNKVYGRPNQRWTEDAKANPAVVYAVTGVATNEMHHLMLAFGGDDSLRGWMNGSPLVQQNSNVPLETTRMVMGVDVDRGPSYFVFKVPQTTLYWQLLFEPDDSLPYAHPTAAVPLPVSGWK